MTSTFNAELADQVLAQIKAHPESWNQEEWAQKPMEDEDGNPVEQGEVCQTAFCFAGWACFFSGVGFRYTQQYIATNNGVDEYCLVGTQTDDAESIQYTAETILGIPMGRGMGEGGLFEANNSLEDLERIVSEYKAESQL